MNGNKTHDDGSWNGGICKIDRRIDLRSDDGRGKDGNQTDEIKNLIQINWLILHALVVAL
jgi:hypothetical protein